MTIQERGGHPDNKAQMVNAVQIQEQIMDLIQKDQTTGNDNCQWSQKNHKQAEHFLGQYKTMYKIAKKFCRMLISIKCKTIICCELTIPRLEAKRSVKERKENERIVMSKKKKK